MILGMIGCGHMGEAMLAGAIDSMWINRTRVVVHTHTEQRMEQLQTKYGMMIAHSNQEVASTADVIILAVKPILYESVLQEIQGTIRDGAIVVGIAPSYSIQKIRQMIGNDRVKVARAMPNTPSFVGKGMTALCFSETLNKEERELISGFFQSFGETREVKEELLPAVGSISGSSPAFLYMVIEGMAEAGIRLGMSSEDAYFFASKTMEGAALMVANSGKHPAELRDDVCSAGGTTIAGVVSLEKSGIRGAMIEAMEVTAKRFLEMQVK